MNEKNYDWFVWPADGHSNEVLSREIFEDATQTGIVCADDERRNMWQCNYETAKYAWKSRHELHVDIKIFGRVGRGKNRSAGKPKDLTFMFQKPAIPCGAPKIPTTATT
jgi:hypothetical protein